METISTPAVTTPTNTIPAAPLTMEQVKLWSVLAHLAFVAGYAVPFSSLVGLLVLRVTYAKQNEVLGQNVKSALNLELTTLIVMMLSVGIMFTVILAPIGILAMLVFVPYRIVAGILAAIQASDGRVATYKLSIAFLRN